MLCSIQGTVDVSERKFSPSIHVESDDLISADINIYPFPPRQFHAVT